MSNNGNFQYTCVPVIKWLISNLHNDNIEADGLATWNAILNLRFPSTQGFLIRPYMHCALRECPGWFELQISHMKDGLQNPVLVLYYQRADRQDDDQWENGQRELQLYLAFRYRSLAYTAAPIYGILAIGAKLKIFQYDNPSRSIEHFVPPWDLERHDEQVWNMLRKISSNHTGGGGCQTRGVKTESGGRGNDGPQNVSGTCTGVDVGSQRL
ncbi:unnamed protein product [Penicillium nalgiovense]|uniref:Uncharacterized protein n=1 Tax=Penicillium nalgiovense TaxID=60175 RepID=A0A1V6XZ80_PENNA|nr:hypothetical protein PENNAL_c0046G01617 [Penicillium nalgiovense]CAG7954378.1 unnamed protein product [Penicillium nalgiovense]CAG8047737.1 unnamed protein product [Penicillium nalgiovense]CAG8181646.1 unnamed protein product [Penicillium nalgiovense]CAG8185979.1 unnamed protein product [Penicillium nalgiovense]